MTSKSRLHCGPAKCQVLLFQEKKDYIKLYNFMYRNNVINWKVLKSSTTWYNISYLKHFFAWKKEKNGEKPQKEKR